MSWPIVQEKYRNSVIQLLVRRGVYDAWRPYAPPEDEEVTGTGFLIDPTHIATNAHVVLNALSIIGRVPNRGKEDISIFIESICPEKDVAICKLEHRLDSIPLPLSEDPINPTEEVLAIGYPLGQEGVKFSTGIVAGFHPHLSAEPPEKIQIFTLEETTSFIQTTVPVNEGNSGGPLINRKGHVIGIISSGYEEAQSISLAVPIQAIKTLRNRKSLLCNVPRLSLEWAPVTLMMDPKGIRVACVYPDSFLYSEQGPTQGLDKGDIITEISFDNRKFTFDDYGDILPESCSNGGCHRMRLVEAIELIPYGAQVEVLLCRGKQWYKLTAPFLPRNVPRIEFVFPHYHPFEYKFLGGMCVTSLTRNHCIDWERLRVYVMGKQRYRPRVVITQVFPDTVFSRIFPVGDLLWKINGKKIYTLDDIVVTKIMNVESKSHKLAVVDSKTLEREARAIEEELNAS